jgi:two-component system chemotaxis response regulator CheB
MNINDRTTSCATGNPPAAPPELIVIAASADGLTAIGSVLGVLPESFPIPLAVVSHRGPESLLPSILGRRCAMRVKEAEEGETPQAGTVYLAPPRRHLVLHPNRTFHLMDGRTIKHLYSSANPLFESSARVLNGRVIAVVLSGSGTDATDGVQTVKQMGGTVIAQDPQQSAFSGMPRAAIRTGTVDLILPLNEIPSALLRLAGRARADGDENLVRRP